MDATQVGGRAAEFQAFNKLKNSQKKNKNNNNNDTLTHIHTYVHIYVYKCIENARLCARMQLEGH